MAVIVLPSSGRAAKFEMSRSMEKLPRVTGVQQITSFPDRRWIMSLEIPPQRDALLKQWSLAMAQLSDISNVFAYGPPWYTGPSTGYGGSSPLVMGGSQLGLTLDVDGLTPSMSVLTAGDFISFDTTSSGGSTNRQLNMVTSDVSSDISGEATLNLLYPIRQAPADNAGVNIITPTAFFSFANAVGGVNRIEILWAGFSIEAEEMIFP